jgi:hypothetical protein
MSPPPINDLSMFHMKDDHAVLSMIHGIDNPVGTDPVPVQPLKYALKRFARRTRVRQEMLFYLG